MDLSGLFFCCEVSFAVVATDAFWSVEDGVAAKLLDDALDRHRVLMADLVLVEILRGIDTELETSRVLRTLSNLPVYELGGERAVVKAAEHYRFLRSKGKTVRGAIDLLLATWCIENGVPLLHADRDFSGFEMHLGLKIWPVTSPTRN